MGYKRAKKQYRLKFEDPDMAGFEVVMGSLSVGELMDLTGSVTAAQTDAAAGAAGNAAMLAKFAAKIISWNLEDEDGTPVPATLEGVKTQDLGFVMEIITAWMEATAGVDPTSQAAANGTGTLPAVSLPMERLSVSLPN